MEKLLIFIPAYNCEKQVPRVLSQLLDPHVLPWVGECIVVNNRSTDGTEAAVQAAATRWPSVTQPPTATSTWWCCMATTRALSLTCCLS